MPPTLSVREATLEQSLILSHIVQGIGSQESKMIARFLAPIVPVPSRSGKIIKFDNSNAVIYETRRAPGAETNRRTLGYTGISYNLCQDSIEGELPIEILLESKFQSKHGACSSGRNIPFSLEKRVAEAAMESINLRLEYDVSAKLTDSNTYNSSNILNLAGTTDVFDDPNSDIIAMFDLAREQISASSLGEMNSAVMSRKAFNSLINHPQIRAYFQGVDSTVVAEEQLASILRLNRGLRVAKARMVGDGTGANFETMFGNNVVLAYVPEKTTADRLEPAFAYTYQLEGYAIAEVPYYDHNHKTWYYPVTDERECVVVGKDSGFLMQNVTTP